MESLGEAEGFLKFRKEEMITQAGLAGEMSTGQRQSSRLKRRDRDAGKEQMDWARARAREGMKGRIFEHHWEMRFKLLNERRQRIEEIPKGKRPCD